MPRGMKIVGLFSMECLAIEVLRACSPALRGPRPALYWREGGRGLPPEPATAGAIVHAPIGLFRGVRSRHAPNASHARRIRLRCDARGRYGCGGKMPALGRTRRSGSAVGPKERSRSGRGDGQGGPVEGGYETRGWFHACAPHLPQ
jgi:hypothetical protein